MRRLLPGLVLGAGYFLALTGLAAATIFWDIPLSDGGFLFSLPSSWSLFLSAFYYLVPFALGLALAFWQGRNWTAGVLLVGAIFILHGAVSLAANSLRNLYLADWQLAAQQAERAEITPSSFRHEFLDENNDGLSDRILVTGALTVGALPPGPYQVLGLLSQGESDAALPGLGAHDIQVEPGASDAQDLRFKIDPRRLQDWAGKGPFSVELEISQWREIGPDVKRVLTFCAWALWCPTALSGADPEFYPDLKVIARLQNLDRFVLRRDQIQRPQLIFNGYSRDYGRDLDGNGLMDELVIALNVDSIWTGELFFQSQLNVLSAAINYETTVAKGVGIVELVIDGSAIKAGGRDGPYRLENPIIFNNTPYCPGGTCANKNQPMFSISAPDYTTGPYRAADFE